MAQLQRGQVCVRFCVAVCHCGHLLLPLHRLPAPWLLRLKAPLPHHHRVLPAPGHHRGLHLTHHVGLAGPSTHAAEQVRFGELSGHLLQALPVAWDKNTHNT